MVRRLKTNNALFENLINDIDEDICSDDGEITYVEDEVNCNRHKMRIEHFISNDCVNIKV